MVTKPENTSLDGAIAAISLNYWRFDDDPTQERHVVKIGAPALVPVCDTIVQVLQPQIDQLNEQIAALGYKHRVYVSVFVPDHNCSACLEEVK